MVHTFIVILQPRGWIDQLRQYKTCNKSERKVNAL